MLSDAHSSVGKTTSSFGLEVAVYTGFFSMKQSKV